MAFTNDDLENNPFYNELETKYIEKYKEAQKNLWIICVPCLKSIKGHLLTKDFVDLHILKPSPFFKSHFVTTDMNNSMSFEMEDGCIKTSTGPIKILMEIIAYNQDYKPYSIFITEGPLCSLNKLKDDLLNNSNSKSEKFSVNDCTTFLMSFPECSEVMKMLDSKLCMFNSSYMILPDYLQDASVKLQSVLNFTISEFFRCLHYRQVNDYSKNEISAALENYIMCHVHDKVFPVIKNSCLEEDKKITQKLLTLYESHITPDQLGVHDSFCCHTPCAIVELASLNSRCSPMEKLYCLMSTLELLNQDVENFLQDTCYPIRKEPIRLTSDDLIPLLVYVIVHSRPQYFVSNLQYIQSFCWENSRVDKLSFGLVTFQAAKEFLMSNEFEYLKPSARKIKKELSLEELMEVTVELQNNLKPSIETKPETFQSPTDHLLENVTKMIEASTIELRDWTHVKDATHNEKEVSNTKQKENVGDFLSSLRQKSLGLSYGKQS